MTEPSTPLSNAQTETEKKHQKNSTKSELAPDSASGFSEEAEKKFQEKQQKKNKMLESLHSVMKKGFLPPEVKTESTGRWRDLKVRTIWTFVMVFLFFLILSMGHLYSAILVCLIIICINYELIDLPVFKERNDEIKNYRFVSWFIFLVGLYYLYISTIMSKIQYLNKYKIFYFLLRYHSFISFMLYCLGFFFFILSLKKGYYKYQFRQFAYIHIILFIFGFFSSLIISNIFNGICWFLIPASCVIMNDISAYCWGRMFGKHPLSPLSPKKTWEGFIGGFLTTLVWAVLFTELLQKHKFILCPVDEISATPFEIFGMKCEVGELRKLYKISFTFLGREIIYSIRAIQIHALSISLFAGLIAPLGGLFASGFKRAIKIKDFANTIPGHGGLTDRMDCELLMGVFTYVYLKQFVFFDEKNYILKKLISLNKEDQLFIYQSLKEMLGI